MSASAPRTASHPRPELRSDYARAATVTAAFVAGLRLIDGGFGARAAVGAVFAATVVFLAAYDLEHRIIPNRIVVPAAGVVLALQVAFFPDRALEWSIAATGAAGFLLVTLLAYPAGVGMGDVKVAFLLGAALGKMVMTAMLLGLLSASVLGLILLVREGATARKKSIPLGPFLAFGGIAALFLS